jgi:hypothetical protein
MKRTWCAHPKVDMRSLGMVLRRQIQMDLAAVAARRTKRHRVFLSRPHAAWCDGTGHVFGWIKLGSFCQKEASKLF